MGAEGSGFENPKECLMLLEPQQERKPRDHKPEEDLMTSPPEVGQRAVPDPLEEASQLHDLAVASREQGQYAEAAACARQALAIFEREVGADHPDVANVLGNLVHSQVHFVACDFCH